MNEIKVFVASSIEELHNERIAMGAIELRINEKLRFKNSYVRFLFCEDYDSAYNGNRKQDEYNVLIPSCDFFFLLLYMKAGDKTVEEFRIAEKSFKSSGRPVIMVYEKVDSSITKTQELISFEHELRQLNHNPILFSSYSEFKESIKEVLISL